MDVEGIKMMKKTAQEIIDQIKKLRKDVYDRSFLIS